MSRPAIVRPVPLRPNAGRSSAGAGLANLLTPDPREAFLAGAAGSATLAFDLVRPGMVDSFLLGFGNAPEGATLAVHATAPGGGETMVAQVGAPHSYRSAPQRHWLAVLDAPVPAERVRFVASGFGQPLVAGVAAIGLAIRPEGYELGSGRVLADTGRAERLGLGGFGVEEGATAGGWAWTMPTLTDEERERLWALHLDLGTTGTLLVVEDPTPGAGLNERIHWGNFTRSEPFARQGNGETRWAMQIQDWA